MINPVELRFGNYILYNNQPLPVKSVSETDVVIDRGSVPASDTNIRPIQLNDIILQAIRQRIPNQNMTCYTYHNTGTFCVYTEDNDSYFVGLNNQGDINHVTITPIRYLHQLQNVCFAQFGEEMTINERDLFHGIEQDFNN